MKKLAGVFNPYGLFILAVFIDYFPSFYQKPKFTIAQLGPVHLYFIDVIFLFLLVYAFFSVLRHGSNQSPTAFKRKNTGTGVLIIFALFFAYSCLKWVLQGTVDTASIRMMLSYTPAYLFLFFFPQHMARKEGLRTQLYLLVLFLGYIFILHIYGFATQGFKIHILGGAFLSMLGMLYFLSLRQNDLLKLSSTTSLFLKGFIIVTYFMVGHRSGLVALLVGLFVYSFFYRKSAFKEIFVLIIIIIISASIALIVSPKTLLGVEERAATTFDPTQQTYEGRFYNIFTVLELSKEHPLIGKPLVTNENVQMKRMEITEGNITSSVEESIVTPHNLVLEWLLYYGWLGVLLGLSLLFAAIRHGSRFLRVHKNDARCYQIGVVMLCTFSHNLFFALSNVTTNDVFGTYFLYLPVVILIAVSRNEKGYCK